MAVNGEPFVLGPFFYRGLKTKTTQYVQFEKLPIGLRAAILDKLDGNNAFAGTPGEDFVVTQTALTVETFLKTPHAHPSKELFVSYQMLRPFTSQYNLNIRCSSPTCTKQLRSLSSFSGLRKTCNACRKRKAPKEERPGEERCSGCLLWFSLSDLEGRKTCTNCRAKVSKYKKQRKF